MKKFAVGTALLHYNRWTGWESEKVREAFQELNFNEVKRLRPNDQIWFDVDPLHPNGKVYGFVLVEIKNIEIDEDRVKIVHTIGFNNIRRKNSSTEIFRLKNEHDMLLLAEQNPLATQILTKESKKLAKEFGLC